MPCSKRLCVVVFSLILLPMQAFAVTLVVQSSHAKIFDRPTVNAKVVTYLGRGRRLQAASKTIAGFFKLITRSGRPLYIQESDVRAVKPLTQQDLQRPPGSPRALNPASKNSRFRKWTLDLNLSTGSFDHVSYSEVNLGLSHYFSYWLAWRNAAFYRFYGSQQADNFYGLDSSFRAFYRQELGSLGVSAFAGPGARLPSKGQGTPFVEGGVVLSLFGLSVGGGVKQFMNKWTDSKAQANDTQYFIVLTGSYNL